MTSDTNTWISIICFTSVYIDRMCYMYVSVCIFCDNHDIVDMKLCKDRDSPSICVSTKTTSDISCYEPHPNVNMNMFWNDSTQRFEIALMGLIDTEYSDEVCSMCEKSVLCDDVRMKIG